MDFDFLKIGRSKNCGVSDTFLLNDEIVQRTESYVHSQLSDESSGHDWWHIHRVWQTAKKLAEKENADQFIVQLAALLHDIADWKFYNGNEDIGQQKARAWLEQLKLDEKTISHVCQIIKDISFKGAHVITTMKSKEGMIVQDADRLDALGAIGIARAFAYGGHKGREMYNPSVKPELHISFDQYKKKQSHTINHFYEKLLLLKERMNTEAAKTIAEERHKFMESYLKRFFEEWDGN